MTMEHASPSKTARCEPMAVDTLRIQGDTGSCGQGLGARGHVLAVPWPEELLSQFGLRMAGHGMSISRTHMLGNPRYALQQLVHARALGDDTLDLLVGQLFRCFEAHQSGVCTPPH
jgi:hypothetical protein